MESFYAQFRELVFFPSLRCPLFSEPFISTAFSFTVNASGIVCIVVLCVTHSANLYAL